MRWKRKLLVVGLLFVMILTALCIVLLITHEKTELELFSYSEWLGNLNEHEEKLDKAIVAPLRSIGVFPKKAVPVVTSRTPKPPIKIWKGDTNYTLFMSIDPNGLKQAISNGRIKVVD